MKAKRAGSQCQRTSARRSVITTLDTSLASWQVITHRKRLYGLTDARRIERPDELATRMEFDSSY